MAALEKAGLDQVWVAEPYGFDAVSLMGYLAAKTETVQIGAGILNIYSRTPGTCCRPPPDWTTCRRGARSSVSGRAGRR